VKNLPTRVLKAILGGIATAATLKVLGYGWRKVTGAPPPSADDPDTPLKQALTWAALSGLVVAAIQVLAGRIGSTRKAATALAPAELADPESTDQN
jgi:hypothetical protein